MAKPAHMVKYVQTFPLPNQTAHLLEVLIKRATSLRGKKVGSVTVTARLFPYPRQGTEYFDFSIEIKKQDLSKDEKKKIFSEAVNPTIKYQKVGLLFAIEQVLTGILISFRGRVFALWDGQQFHSL